ncbi:hypothetical protein [Chondromyces apiculatus]|uniref:Uncharacterized protein n=1 Tax=Chondromyces apiculatus DSM 436 TaxID=1192034 RepID=A0A017SZC6_9BACT|nr:hypothetical protein [Chondromyces apiculatus]EYF02349.1 Hypothetical protein CAP_7278 [Chondromyces apiculatus DSM 436]
MSRAKTPPPNTAPAARMAELLAATEPEAAEVLGEHARKHFERTRKKAARAPVPLKELVQKATKGAQSRAQDAQDAQTEVAAGERSYQHEGPTKSKVLNAFVHELGSERLVSVDTAVLHEEVLAPKLFELARRYMVRLLMIIGRTDTALGVAPMVRPVVNEMGARLHLRQAAREQGALGDIARDYVERYERQGRPERDDREASCMMAAFAGRLLGYAEAKLGEHVRDEVREALLVMLESGRATSRRRRTPPRQASAAASPAASEVRARAGGEGATGEAAPQSLLPKKLSPRKRPQ